MEPFLFYLALVTLLFWIVVGVDIAAGNRSMKFLKDIELALVSPPPRVSVIIPARNEEKNIREALQSLLAQDYPNLEFIAINDRSTDRTGAILADLVLSNPRLRVIEIKELPPGWLGKNHALQRGAETASGALLLFTDADVVMDLLTLSRAVSFMTANGLDHLSIAPEVRMPGTLLGMFASAFGIFFAIYARPWKARDPQSSRAVGVGAFNLVGAEAYRVVGGHRAIAMRPDDDMKLGKLLKKNRFRQEVLFGAGMIHVEWYSTLGELVGGLLKNVWAGLDYRISALIGTTVFLFLFYVWPFAAAFTTGGATRVLNLTTVLVIFALAWDSARFHNLKRWYGIGFPVCTLLFIYILLRSMLWTLAKGGIAWRGTNYSLADLKANKI